MIESIIIIIVVSLCFFALFQYASLFSAKAILYHAAACAARARTVGFNEWMTRKSALVASIPASGERIAPAYSGVDTAITAALKQGRVGDIWDLALRSSTRSPSTAIEVGRIPEFMEGVNEPSARAVLDYALWEDTTVSLDEPISVDGDSPVKLTATVRQRHPLFFLLEPLAEGSLSPAGDDESISLRGVFSIESHYPLYLEDAKW